MMLADQPAKVRATSCGTGNHIRQLAIEQNSAFGPALRVKGRGHAGDGICKLHIKQRDTRAVIGQGQQLVKKSGCP
jgi:hypothetical protein